MTKVIECLQNVSSLFEISNLASLVMLTLQLTDSELTLASLTLHASCLFAPLLS